jgi:hypothetical protein
MSYWVVRVKHVATRKVMYLQDQGMLRTKEEPYGGPGLFASGKRTAYRFASGQQAEQARNGMLGQGRTAEVLQVVTKGATRTMLVDKALANLERQYGYESDCPGAHLQPDDCSWRAIGALLRYVEQLEKAQKRA